MASANHVATALHKGMYHGIYMLHLYRPITSFSQTSRLIVALSKAGRLEAFGHEIQLNFNNRQHNYLAKTAIPGSLLSWHNSNRNKPTLTDHPA
ncbi:hypothetical protein HYFRA_00003801 [Hymenoscyphus fraxineus]|uniref:Uncharacterized protein n=1 Tax=Hymenoscyphus fraxineus TaxID=746836 RepID=A0A9N9L179_9HELO|nr:hypothetical protein HYFRA_00003801 [Hymenoscyphus fraxineus]